METKRLYLRERTKELMENVFHQPIEEQLAFFGCENKTQLEVELERIKKGLTNWKMDYKLWDLIEKSSQKVIGNGGFHSWYRDHERAELGYALFEGFRKKGYMLEALNQMIAHGFDEMQLNRIEAFVGPSNIPSIKLIEKLGFTKEGILREHYKKNNQIEDSIVYALLESEYAQQ